MWSEQLFTTEIESRNGVARMALRGELDMATAPGLKESLGRLELDETMRAILLDLRDLTFIDSSGLHAFVEARKRAQANGHRLALVGATPAARQLFEITGTEFLIDEAEAMGIIDQFTGGRARRSAHASSTAGHARN